MSCKEENKRDALLSHLKEHVSLFCSSCKIDMKAEDGNLAFGNAMMARFICPKCEADRIFVIQEDGKILEAGT